MCVWFICSVGQAYSTKFELIEEKIPLDPPVAVWSAMLGACKMHKNFNLDLRLQTVC